MANDTNTSAEGGSSYLPVIIGVVTVLLLGGGAAYYYFNKKKKTDAAVSDGASGDAAADSKSKTESNSPASTDSKSIKMSAQDKPSIKDIITGKAPSAAPVSKQKQSQGEANVDAKEIATQFKYATTNILGHTPKNNSEWQHALDVSWSNPSSGISDLIKKLNDNGYILTRNSDGQALPIDDQTTVDGNPIGGFAQDKIYKLQKMILTKQSSVNRQ
jgi:flagellar basal body-associated protein FliL